MSTTLPTDADLINLCAQIYDGTGAWDHLDTGRDDGVYWALKKLAGCDVVVFRGSITTHDWAEDFRAFPIPTRIGIVHFGFFDGLERVWRELARIVSQPVMVAGHSLGAARADMLCALMAADGRPPIRRAVFGEPRPGFADFAAFLQSIPGASYRNADAHGHDLVTDVPPALPGGFIHPTPLVDITAAPVGDVFDLFRYHHVQLYQAALSKEKQDVVEFA